VSARLADRLRHFLRRVAGSRVDDERTLDHVASPTRIILGLGNPGEEYADTRHNVGFRVADAVAERSRTSMDRHAGSSVVGDGRWKGRPFVVAKPLTWMNRSGEAARALLRRFSVSPNELLVVVDDINLPLGTVRLRRGGGTGGHNGLEDIADTLNTHDFPRLRVGIGSDFARGNQSDYVLSPFEAGEFELVDDTVSHAAEAALCFVTDGVQTAMNRYNRAAPGSSGEQSDSDGEDGAQRINR